MPKSSPNNTGDRPVKCSLWKNSGVDALGGPNQTPVLAGYAWAWINSLRGMELAAAQQINPQVNARITVRHSDIRAFLVDGSIVKMYLQDGTDYYDIQGPLPRDSRNQWVDLICILRVGQPPIFA